MAIIQRLFARAGTPNRANRITMKSGKKYVLFHSDPHAGHSLGLLNPKTEFVDYDEMGNATGGTYALTHTQNYLWECLQEDIAGVKRKIGGDPLTIVFLGDLTHGTKYTEQVFAPTVQAQINIALFNAVPLVEIPNVTRVRLAHGTGSHGFYGGSSDILIADALQKRFHELDIKATRHGLANVDGCIIDYAHHGPPPGSRIWLEGNMARFYMRDLMIAAALDGDRVPRVAARGHHHVYIRETVRVRVKRKLETGDFITVPAYCGLSEFAQKVSRSSYKITNGMVLLEIENGELCEIHPFTRTVDLRMAEDW